jgi:hypothetical protein
LNTNQRTSSFGVAATIVSLSIAAVYKMYEMPITDVFVGVAATVSIVAMYKMYCFLQEPFSYGRSSICHHGRKKWRRLGDYNIRV